MSELEISEKEKTPEKWQDKVDITYEDYFRAPFLIPHPGAVELARELEALMGKEKAHETVGKVFERLAIDQVKKRVKEEPINSFEEFKNATKKSMKQPFFSHALNFTIVEETSKKLSSNITECLFAKIFKEMNATDLGYIMLCKPDLATTKIYNPKLNLTRTKTLMQGDECCNPIVTWEE
jgi:hypothetical protein